MPRYQLLAKHYLNDTLLEPGTMIGDGTPHRLIGPPTDQMRGMDEEAEKIIQDERERQALVVNMQSWPNIALNPENLQKMLELANAQEAAARAKAPTVAGQQQAAGGSPNSAATTSGIESAGGSKPTGEQEGA